MLAARQIQSAGGLRLAGSRGAGVKLARPGLPIRHNTTRPVAARRVQRVSNVKVQALGNLFGSILKPLTGADDTKRKELVEELLEGCTDPKPDQEIISDIVSVCVC